ncbi:REP-associated tyrosine transposase [Hydrocarboniphaga sp.]|uniref:REP-associated tyrosine transposase n=1 Tax=Hydrocarboniphaga sp. TaxID=2033016 RepID=UPI003D0A09FC
MPPDDSDYSNRIRSIKRGFTSEVLRSGIAMPGNGRGEYSLWQRRFWEHTIRDGDDYARHVDYIHYNPVRHGLVSAVGDWPYSSFHRYVRQGLLPNDWGGVNPEPDQDVYGEPRQTRVSPGLRKPW